MFKQITKICLKAITNYNYFGLYSIYSNARYSFANQKNLENSLTGKFTEIGYFNKKDEIVTNGRSWHACELRLKSNQDLHKLWYVCVRQKNSLLADLSFLKNPTNKKQLQFRILKLKKTMSRILTVIGERAEIRKKYRQKLQQQYIQKKRIELQKQISKQPQPLPQISWQILRSKYQELRRGIDNVDYLQRIWEQKEIQTARKQRGQVRTQKLIQQSYKFNSFWDKEKTYEQRPTQEEILRAHVTNWRQLNLKQRKIILGFLNANRAKSAKKDFVKQLKILGQKIAHQQVKERTEAK